ncbi:MAG: SPOR domain-containing protein [Prevotella sp.]|nr:SPOR domain-containing protein [Prevotella sp.]
MMELERHIEVLLLSNDCVIVPGLGGFMTHHVCARYDEKEKIFLPPLRTLGFNSQLTMSDTLLAQSYADTYDISITEAVERISQEVRRLKYHIEKNGSYSMNGIGRMSLNADGNYEFEPCEAGVLTPWLYGLDAYEFYRLHAQHQQQPLPLPGRMVVVSSPEDKQLSSRSHKPSLATIMSQIDNAPEREEKTISIKVSVLRNLAVTAVAAAALFLFARPVSPDEMNAIESGATEASVLPTSTVEEEVIPTTPPRSIIGLMDAVSNRLNQEEEVGVPPSAGDFTVVLGYSIPSENVQSFLDQLHAQGAKKAVLIDYKSQNVIVYGSYKTHEEANEALQNLLANKNASSGWIMQMK